MILYWFGKIFRQPEIFSIKKIGKWSRKKTFNESENVYPIRHYY